MQDFGQLPYDPFADPLDYSLGDPFGNPFDPSIDPFEAISDAMSSPLPESFGIIEPSAAGDFQELPEDQESLHMDGLGRMLGLGEDHIENSPPIPPALQPDNLEALSSDPEDNREGGSESFDKHMEAEPSQDPAWWYSSPAVGTPPPPPGVCDHPEIRPIRGDRPARQQLGTNRTKTSADDKRFCPLEDDYISTEACENRECQHYDYEAKWCTYYDDQH